MTVDSMCVTGGAPSGTIIRLLDHPKFKRTLPCGRTVAPQSALPPLKNALGGPDQLKQVPAFVLTGLVGIYAIILVDLSLRFLV